MSFREEVIWELYPETHSISDEPVGVLDKNNNKIKLDESAIAIKEAELQAEYDAQEYARARRPLYPDIGDQLDDLYHKGVFSAEMTATLKKVKDDNPK